MRGDGRSTSGSCVWGVRFQVARVLRSFTRPVSETTTFFQTSVMTRSSNAKLRTYVFCSVFRHIPNETHNRLAATQLKIFNYSSCRDAIFGLKNRVKRRAGRPPSCLRRSLAVVALFRFAALVRSCFRSPPFRRGKPYSLSVVVVSGPVFSLDFGCFEAVQVPIGIKNNLNNFVNNFIN